MIISFAWTTPALLAGRKTVTRREWPAHYARRFKAGTVHQAWSRSPRCRVGAYHVADIRLLEAPYLECSTDIPPSDWEAEGFAYLESIGATMDGVRPQDLWDVWLLNPRDLYVVRFELVRVIPNHLMSQPAVTNAQSR